MSQPPSRRVCFLRPGLGFGGGDRWCIDAARALAEHGWTVRRCIGEPPTRIFTDAHDSLPPPEIVARLAPQRSEHLKLLRAWWRLARVLRTAAAAGPAPEVVVLDQMPHLAPAIRRRWPRARVVMYCHFPDGLIRAEGGGPLRQAYRRALTRAELRGLAACHAVAVNSAYTGRALARMAAQHGLPSPPAQIIHPGVPIPAAPSPWPAPGTPLHLLSVGRIQGDKRLDLALDAWALARRLVGPAASSAAWRLTLLGGYNPHHKDAIATRRALAARIAAEGWRDSVHLVCDASPAQLEAAFAAAHACIHPMPGEHFGIAPLEALARGRPVLATVGAGPDETIGLDGGCGALRPFAPAAFAEVIAAWARDPDALRPLGVAARHRAERFSLKNFSARWVAFVTAISPPPTRRSPPPAASARHS